MNTEQTPIDKAIAALEDLLPAIDREFPFGNRTLALSGMMVTAKEALAALRSMPTPESAEPMAWMVVTKIGSGNVVTHAATRTAVAQIAVERYRGAPGAIHGAPIPLYTYLPKPEQPHVHTVYDAVGGGYVCSGCEQRFVAPAAGLTVEEVMEVVKVWHNYSDLTPKDAEDLSMNETQEEAYDDLRARLTAAINAKTEKP